MPPERQPSNLEIRTVTSADGTCIAYEYEGDGKPLILLHGGSGTRRAWDTLRPYLSDEFSLYVPDRRGRGDSGDSSEYSLDREVADLRALVGAIDGAPIVFGHSFGGLVALAGASAAIDSFVLYEPPILVDEHSDDDLAARMEERLESGARQEAMRLFIEETGTVSDVDQLPWWPEEANLHLTDSDYCESLPLSEAGSTGSRSEQPRFRFRAENYRNNHYETVIRENYEVESFDMADISKTDVLTLLLTGEQSPAHLRDSIAALDDPLTESHLIEMEDVGHVATESAPEELASLIKSHT